MIVREFEIAAPREIVFEVISDFSSYPEFLNTADRVEVSEVAGQKEATFELSLIKKISYCLRFESSPPEFLKWSLVKGDFMKKNSGSWKLESLEEAKTKATYSVEVEFSWMVPKGMVDKLTESQLPGLLKAFRERAEDCFKRRQNV